MKKAIILLLLFFVSVMMVQTTVFAQPNVGDAVGTLKPTVANEAYACSGDICIIYFFSNLIKIMTVLAGIWTLFMFLTGAFQMINNPKAEAYSKASAYFTQASVGMVLIVASYTIAGILGLLFWGDATFIINPKIDTSLF